MIVTIKHPDYDYQIPFQFMTHEKAVEFIGCVAEHSMENIEITFRKEQEDDNTL